MVRRPRRHALPYPQPGGHGYADACAYGYTNGDTDGKCDGKPHGDSHSNSHSDCKRHADANSDRHSDEHGYTKPDTLRGDGGD